MVTDCLVDIKYSLVISGLGRNIYFFLTKMKNNILYAVETFNGKDEFILEELLIKFFDENYLIDKIKDPEFQIKICVEDNSNLDFKKEIIVSDFSIKGNQPQEREDFYSSLASKTNILVLESIRF